jgi:RNA polymerase sigma factor (TIGR02999 family)
MTLHASWMQGSGSADACFPEVYAELSRVAHRLMARERPDHTLEPSALVHEAYLRLNASGEVRWRDDAHFFALAARAMRHVLVDHARRRSAVRRRARRVDLDVDQFVRTGSFSIEGLLAVELVLTRLAERKGNGQRLAQLVELVWLAGMEVTAAAEEVGIGRRQAHRDLRFAQVWIARELST